MGFLALTLSVSLRALLAQRCIDAMWSHTASRTGR